MKTERAFKIRGMRPGDGKVKRAGEKQKADQLLQARV